MTAPQGIAHRQWTHTRRCRSCGGVAGRQFDAELVDMFIAMLEKEGPALDKEDQADFTAELDFEAARTTHGGSHRQMTGLRSAGVDDRPAGRQASKRAAPAGRAGDDGLTGPPRSASPGLKKRDGPAPLAPRDAPPTISGNLSVVAHGLLPTQWPEGPVEAVNPSVSTQEHRQSFD